MDFPLRTQRVAYLHACIAHWGVKHTKRCLIPKCSPSYSYIPLCHHSRTKFGELDCGPKTRGGIWMHHHHRNLKEGQDLDFDGFSWSEIKACKHVVEQHKMWNSIFVCTYLTCYSLILQKSLESWEYRYIYHHLLFFHHSSFVPVPFSLMLRAKDDLDGLLHR